MKDAFSAALLPDPAMLVARLRQWGMTDAPIDMVTLPTMYSHTLLREAAGDGEMLLNAVVSAHGGRDGGLALVMTAYGDGESPQPDAMQVPLASMLRNLYREAGLADVPKEALDALHAPMPTAPASDTPVPNARCWTSEGVHIEWDFCDEDGELPTLTLTLCRSLPDAEWQDWLRPGGALAVQAAQVRDASESVLARLASMLVAHGHPLAACASDMRVFLSMANDEGGTRTIVQPPGNAGASLWCDENPSGFSIQIVHADGRLERLPADGAAGEQE
jgi:hypothetical protein